MTRYAVCLLVLVLAGCSPAEEETTVAPEALVTIADVRTEDVGETVMLYGIADSGPSGKTSLFAPIEARLAQINAPAGTAVRRGQPILRLEPGPGARLEIAKARSDAQVATAAYARAVRMRGDGLVSDADVETARAARTTADAAIASLTGRGMVLRAPVSGYVEAIASTPGDLVAAGASLVTISGNGAVRARFGIDPAMAQHLRIGAPVSVSTGTSAAKIPARLTAINPTVDPQTKLASVYADLPIASAVRSGEALTGAVTLRGDGQALVIPYAALLDDAGQPFVFVVVKGVAARHDIVTGATDGAVVAVSKGLAAGDRVVVAGGTALEDGMKVRLK